jgi:REP element-mobilizing transposase RayT
MFLGDVDRHDVIKTLAETRQKAGWQVHAYRLLRNHLHLVGREKAQMAQSVGFLRLLRFFAAGFAPSGVEWVNWKPASRSSACHQQTWKSAPQDRP